MMVRDPFSSNNIAYGPTWTYLLNVPIPSPLLSLPFQSNAERNVVDFKHIFFFWFTSVKLHLCWEFRVKSSFWEGIMLALVIFYKLSCGRFFFPSVNVHHNLIIQESLIWAMDEATSKRIKGDNLCSLDSCFCLKMKQTFCFSLALSSRNSNDMTISFLGLMIQAVYLIGKTTVPHMALKSELQPSRLKI